MSQADEHRRAAAAPPEILEERRVDDLETLRMLTDPLRLAILTAFPSGPHARPMTVKEIAEKLDEGQTKLYRHFKQLEDSGLIHVAETRVVSGIIEKRYQPSQKRLTVEGDVLRLFQGVDDFSEEALIAVLDATRNTLGADLRAGRVPLDRPEEGPDISLEIGNLTTNMTPERYARVRAQLTEFIEGIGPGDDDPRALPVRFTAVLYPRMDPPSPSADQNTENPPSTKNS
jgi:DNA-binding transcriptional ArsR family regulator